MNIFEKLQKMRVDLQNMNIKKSGENKFAGYKYYELGDILPPINKLMLENSVTAIVTFGNELAELTLVNAEKPEELITFCSPMATASLKGAHDIQNLGAVETYQRRYLYMAAFEIVESDFFDATQGMNEPKKPEPKKQKPKKVMSEDMSAKLNEAVMAFASLTGTTTKDVMQTIRKETGFNPATMTDANGEVVLKLLHGLSDKFIEELGA